jgi:spermidine synthase
MIPWVRLASAPIPGGGELHLYRHGRDLSIRVGRDELMNSRAHASEDALAALALARLGSRAAPVVLVGGLGMGFTVAAALRGLGPEARIQVAELVPEVVAWNRGELAAVSGNVLEDPRVTVQIGDVAEVLRARRAGFDAILLDVDNGPSGLTAEANHWLYGVAGLQRTYAALRPGGVLTVWSAVRDDSFTRRLVASGFSVELETVHAHGTRGPRHVIWVAQR